MPKGLGIYLFVYLFVCLFVAVVVVCQGIDRQTPLFRHVMTINTSIPLHVSRAEIN